IPHRGGGVQLERIVCFGRRAVSLIELDGRTGKRGVSITTLALQSRHWSIAGKDDVRIVAGFEVRLDIVFFFCVGRTNCVGSSLGGFESVSHDESDVLAVVSDLVVFERRPALETDAIETRRRSGTKDLADIRAMKNFTYARHLLSRCDIERDQFAIRDRRLHWNAVEHSREVEVGSVLGQSCDLAWSIDAQRVASDRRWLCSCHDCSSNQAAAAVRTAYVMQRFANSILNLFSLCGFAPCNAASAAWRKVASFAGLPVSAASASGERQGFVPTPPRAMRARVILPPAIVSTTAVDARANS